MSGGMTSTRVPSRLTTLAVESEVVPFLRLGSPVERDWTMGGVGRSYLRARQESSNSPLAKSRVASSADPLLRSPVWHLLQISGLRVSGIIRF